MLAQHHDDGAMTPLHRAAWLGAAEEAKLLLEPVPTGHAYINRRAMTRFNCTGFILACERGHVTIVQELLTKVDELTMQSDYQRRRVALNFQAQLTDVHAKSTAALAEA